MSRAASPDALEKGTSLRNGTYVLAGVLGRGSYGITYLAKTVRPGRPANAGESVAIKEFYPRYLASRDPRSGRIVMASADREVYLRLLDHFLKEGRILSQIDHPNAVKIHTVFKERGTAYLVMEYVPGRTLQDVLNTQPDHQLPAVQVGEIIGQVVAALDTIHQQGIYHLDIKPDNVRVTGDGRAVLVDFGSAKQGQSSKSTRFGADGYAPPELLTGGAVGPESDIFELGMMAYELLTGVLPPSAATRLAQHLETWEPRGLEEPWRSLVRAAVQLSKDNRPESAIRWWRSAVETQAWPGAIQVEADQVMASTDSGLQQLRNLVSGGQEAQGAQEDSHTAPTVVVGAAGVASKAPTALKATMELRPPAATGYELVPAPVRAHQEVAISGGALPAVIASNLYPHNATTNKVAGVPARARLAIIAIVSLLTVWAAASLVAGAHTGDTSRGMAPPAPSAYITPSPIPQNQENSTIPTQSGNSPAGQAPNPNATNATTVPIPGMPRTGAIGGDDSEGSEDNSPVFRPRRERGAKLCTPCSHCP